MDEKTYSVTGPNGFRRGSMTRAEADALVERMRAHMRAAGWAGCLDVYYRDGSHVARTRI